MSPREPYRPIGENPDPARHPDSGDAPALPHAEDDNPAHDESAAPDD